MKFVAAATLALATSTSAFAPAPAVSVSVFILTLEMMETSSQRTTTKFAHVSKMNQFCFEKAHVKCFLSLPDLLSHVIKYCAFSSPYFSLSIY